MFLLSLRAGSAGLTLTAATRVYLLEPAMDPAIEQQAVARVHRIGQEKEVVITRLLVADTVEEEVRECTTWTFRAVHVVSVYANPSVPSRLGNCSVACSHSAGWAGACCRCANKQGGQRLSRCACNADRVAPAAASGAEDI